LRTEPQAALDWAALHHLLACGLIAPIMFIIALAVLIVLVAVGASDWLH
jgi:hypothetical protein